MTFLNEKVVNTFKERFYEDKLVCTVFFFWYGYVGYKGNVNLVWFLSCLMKEKDNVIKKLYFTW